MLPIDPQVFANQSCFLKDKANARILIDQQKYSKAQLAVIVGFE